jgi:hypothetical protein
MRKRRSRCAPVIELLENRVVLSVTNHSSAAATALATNAVHESGAKTDTGYERGSVIASPGTLVTICGNFDPSASTVVVFTTKTGRKYEDVPPAVTSSSVVIAAPLFIYPTTLRIGAGVDHVVVEQSTSVGTDKTRAIRWLQSLKLPRTGLPPGTVTNSVLPLTQSQLATGIANYQTLSAAGMDPTGGGAAMVQLQDLQQEATALQELILPLQRGQTSQIPLGTFRGARVVINHSSLALIDRLLDASFAGAGVGLSAASAAPAAKTLSDESTQVGHRITEAKRSPRHPDPASSGPTISSLAPSSILAGAIIGPIVNAELSAVKLTGPKLAEAAVLGGSVEFLAAVLEVAVCAGYQYHEFGQLTKALNNVTSHSNNPTSDLATSVQDAERQLQCGTQNTPSIEDLVKQFRNTTSKGQTLENVRSAAAGPTQAAPQQTANIEQRIFQLQNT